MRVSSASSGSTMRRLHWREHQNRDALRDALRGRRDESRLHRLVTRILEPLPTNADSSRRRDGGSTPHRRLAALGATLYCRETCLSVFGGCPMPNRQRYLLITIAVSLLSALAFLFMENTARSPAWPTSAPRRRRGEWWSDRGRSPGMGRRRADRFGSAARKSRSRSRSLRRSDQDDRHLRGRRAHEALAEPIMQADFGEDREPLAGGDRSDARGTRRKAIAHLRPARVDSRRGLAGLHAGGGPGVRRPVHHRPGPERSPRRGQVEQTLVHFDRDPTPAPSWWPWTAATACRALLGVRKRPTSSSPRCRPTIRSAWSTSRTPPGY